MANTQYQVFLNFRGSDTRHTFTDHLYYHLNDVGVHVFRDDKELPEGEKFDGNLLSAIDNSMIYITIFSQTYASSIWCLRELAHIVDNVSRSNGRKSILPIFFNVEPEDVKLRTPLYKDALLKHENKFPDQVGKWREALAEVGKIMGWNVKRDQSEAAIIELVVKTVLEKLELRKKSLTEHLVGLDDRVKDLTELLNVNHSHVLLIGIYGMGGIGKTTIAKVVFNELCSDFGKCCSFLENVRESMSTEDGIVRLQKKLLSNIVGYACAEGVKDSDEGMRKIGETLGKRKVLVVLDDVDNKDHIKKLIGNESLHSASRIIITTRNTAVLQVRGLEDKIMKYEMLKMDDALALQLFCLHAFGRDFPSDDYRELSREFVSSTGGLPLAIEVIGSLLYEHQNNKAVWEETLVKLRNIPEKDIVKKLRISYDDLDENQQEIFLDIACFFCNKSKNDAIYMWTNKSDEQVKGMLQEASKRGSIHLILEDEGDLSSVKRDRTVETDRIPTNKGRGSRTGRSSNPGRYPAERGRGGGIASSSRNSKASRSRGRSTSRTERGKVSRSRGRSTSRTERGKASRSRGRSTSRTERGKASRSRGRSTSRTERGKASRSRGRSTSRTGRGIASRSRGKDRKGHSVEITKRSTLRTGRRIASRSRRGSTLSTGRRIASRSRRGSTLSTGRRIASRSRSGSTLSTGRAERQLQKLRNREFSKGHRQNGHKFKIKDGQGFKLGQDRASNIKFLIKLNREGGEPVMTNSERRHW